MHCSRSQCGLKSYEGNEAGDSSGPWPLFPSTTGVPGEWPMHRTTGSRGYFGNRSSVNERWQRWNAERRVRITRQ
jgi:hypothetical protein